MAVASCPLFPISHHLTSTLYSPTSGSPPHLDCSAPIPRPHRSPSGCAHSDCSDFDPRRSRAFKLSVPLRNNFVGAHRNRFGVNHCRHRNWRDARKQICLNRNGESANPPRPRHTRRPSPHFHSRPIHRGQRNVVHQSKITFMGTTKTGHLSKGDERNFGSARNVLDVSHRSFRRIKCVGELTLTNHTVSNCSSSHCWSNALNDCSVEH